MSYFNQVNIHVHVISLCYVFVKDKISHVSDFINVQAISLLLFTTLVYFSPPFSSFCYFCQLLFSTSCHFPQLLPVYTSFYSLYPLFST